MLDVNSCIQVKELRISRRSSIPNQVDFHLDSNLIAQIEWIQENNYKLILSPSNLANLRYYTLLNSPLEEIGIYLWHSNKFSSVPRSPLTFSTNYSFSPSQKSVTLFRSVIDFDGKISQQINHDLWQNPQLLSQISQAHYWLISEILDQLPLKHKKPNLWLIISQYLILISIISLSINHFLSINYLLSFVIGSAAIWILNINLKIYIIKQLKPKVIYHLIANFLTKNIRFRTIGWKIINFIFLIKN